MATLGCKCVHSMRNISRIFTQICINRSTLISSRGTGLSYSTTTAHANDTAAEKSGSDQEDSGVETAQADCKLSAENERLSVELKDTKDKYVRSLAEMENVRQRMRKQIDDAKLFGIQGFSKDLLEVADVLGKATETVPKEMITDVNPEFKALYEGLVLTESQLIKIFKKHGLEQIIPKEGDKFDPYIHQALFEVPLPDSEPGTIATLSKFGYCLHQRTIRPALVGVVKST